MTKKDELPKEIDNLTKELAKLYDMTYEFAKNDANYIIKNNITDSDIVEHCFDQILNIPTDKGCILLLKLYDYYRNIDRKTADFYLKDYFELYNIRDLPIKKVKKKDYKQDL